MLLFSPQPFHRIWKMSTAKVRVVSVSFGPVKADIISHILQSSRHKLIRPWPASESIVDVSAGVRHVNSNRLWLCFSHQRRIDVAASQIRKAADAGVNLAECISAFPGDGECTNCSRAGTTDGSHLRIIGDVVLLFDFGNDLFQQKACIAIAEPVVFETSIGRFVVRHRFRFIVSRIDEHSNRRRHVTTSDQVVKDDGNSPASFDVSHAFAILKNHQSGWLFLLILSRHIDGPFASRSFEDFGFPRRHFFDFSLRNSFFDDRIGMRRPFRLRLDNWDVG